MKKTVFSILLILGNTYTFADVCTPVPATLLPADPSGNRVDNPGYLLRDAVLKGDLDQLKNLIASGVDVNSTDTSGCTAIHYSIGYCTGTGIPQVHSSCRPTNGPKSVEILIKAGARTDVGCHNGKIGTPLMEVASQEQLMFSDYFNVLATSSPDVGSYTPLMAAASKGNEFFVNALLRVNPKPCRVNAVSNHGSNVIHSLASTTHGLGSQENTSREQFRSLMILEDLRMNGLNKDLIDAQDQDGETPLMIAVRAYNDRLCSYLIELGASLDKKNKYSKSARSMMSESELRWMPTCRRFL